MQLFNWNCCTSENDKETDYIYEGVTDLIVHKVLRKMLPNVSDKKKKQQKR